MSSSIAASSSSSSSSSSSVVRRARVEDEREAYYQKRRMAEQSNKPSYRSCSTITTESFIWTYRTTSCDVISLITTVEPLKNGIMRDIKTENKSIITIKKKSSIQALKDSPFHIRGLHVDVKEEKRKLNKILLAERKVFMTKLNISRYYRSKTEGAAATKIQSLYRGYYARNNVERVTEEAQISKQIRGNIKSFLANRHGMLVSLSSYKGDRMQIRHRSASVIQDCFTQYLSRQCLRRRRQEYHFKRRMNAIIKIQALARAVRARHRVRLLFDKVRNVIVLCASVKIQTCYRALLGRRKLRRRRLVLQMYAASVIVGWYKAKYARRMAEQIQLAIYRDRVNSGATKIQGIVRRMCAKARVRRLQIRYLTKQIFLYATRINCLVRKFLSKIYVNRVRDLKIIAKLKEEELVRSKELAETNASLQQEQKVLLDSVDIFLQAKLGNVVETEDIFMGLADDAAHKPTDVNADGDTVLTIAAGTRNMELLRKSLIWGFDVNHRNNKGETALTLAAKTDSLQLLQYVLSLPATIESNDGEVPITPLEDISEDDAGVLLVAAGANTGKSGVHMLRTLLDLGLSVNSVDPMTGMTAMHAVCEVGHPDAFMLLAKHKADSLCTDNMGMTPLHKACESSLKVVQLILGLDPNFETYMSDEDRTENLLLRDAHDKDALMHATLGGQMDVVVLIENLLESFPLPKPGKSTKSAAVPAPAPATVMWIDSDIEKATALIESGNLMCIGRVVDAGLDVSRIMESIGDSLLIVASRTGNLDVLDVFMSKNVDFSIANMKGMTAMHYSACSAEESMVAHLLMHADAKKCNVSELSLLKKDQDGNTPFHLAGFAGRLLSIDLLAAQAIESVRDLQNHAGMTPIMMAASTRSTRVVEFWLDHGATPSIEDIHGHDTLWHLMHSHHSVIDKYPARRPLCSEYAFMYDLGNRSQRDEAAADLKIEVSLVLSLLSMKCKLYSEVDISAAIDKMTHFHTQDHSPWMKKKGRGSSLRASFNNSVDSHIQSTALNAMSIADLQKLETGDILVHDMALTLLKRAPDLLTQLDCWRLLVSSIACDRDGKLTVFFALIASGIIDRLGNKQLKKQKSVINTIVIDAHAQIVRSEIVSDDMALTTAYVHELTKHLFLDMNLMGWLIRFQHLRGMELLIKKGYDLIAPIDSSGNAYLHTVAQYGDEDMIRLAFIKQRHILLEKKNLRGETALAVAARAQNLHIFRFLADEQKADTRAALAIRYAAWVLAFVIRKERTQVNTQTGSWHSDDEKFFVSLDQML